MKHLIVFDTETTGLIKNVALPLKEQPRIIELFALKLDASTPDLEEIGEWHSMFRVKAIEDDAIKTHGITLEDLKGAPDFAERFADLAEFFLGTRRLVGHNLSFDRDMLWFELRRLGMACAFPWPPIHIDTVEATEGEEGFRLGLAVLYQRLFNEGFAEAHRAPQDTRATARCFRRLVQDGVIRL